MTMRRRSPPSGSPVGAVVLAPVQPIGESVLEQLAEELRLRGVTAETRAPIAPPHRAYSARRRQFRADLLLESVADCDARPVLGVIDADCYAGDLNFVFGIAQVGGGAALVCLHRLRERARRRMFVERAMKEVFHELGHACGLGHCANPRCVMHFSNSLADTDAKSEQLCSACMQRMRK